MPPSKARSRTFVGPGSVWLLGALLVLFPLGIATAESPPSKSPPLLDAAYFQSLRDVLRSNDRRALARGFGSGRASAGTCRVESDTLTCENLRIETDEWILEFETWRRSDDGSATFRELRARHRKSERIVTAERLELRDSVLRAEPLRVARADGSGLWIGSAAVDDGDIALSELRWRRFQRRPRESDSRKVPGLRASGRPDLRAQHARHRDGSWAFEQVATTPPLPLPVGPLSGRRPTPVTGFVPPTFTYGADRFEFLQRGFHGPSGLGLSLTAAPDAWYGIGPTLATSPSSDWPNVRGADRPPLLDAHLLYDSNSNSPEAAAVGDMRFGGGHLHASGSFEEMTRAQYWRTRRVERRALFRPWRRSALGAAFSGSSHHFQIRAAHWNPARFDDLPAGTSEPPSYLSGEEAELRLRFGTEAQFGDHVALSTDVYHQNHARAAAVDDHGSALITAVSGHLGRTSRLFGEAQLASLLGTTLASPNPEGRSTSGFQAAPVTQILGSLRGGLVLRGEFSETTHLVRPSVTLYRELAGRGTTPGADTPFPAPFARVPSWTLAGIVLDQTLRGESVEFGLPVGLLAAGSGISDAVTSPAHLLARARLAWPTISLRSGVLAPSDFGTVDGFASAGLDGEPWSAAVGATTLEPAETGWLHADDLLPHAAETMRLLEGQKPTPRPSGAHNPADIVPYLTFDWDDAVNRFEATVFAEGPLTRSGLSAGWTRRFRRFGWGLGVNGSTTIPTGNWGVTAGLRRSGTRR